MIRMCMKNAVARIKKSWCRISIVIIKFMTLDCFKKKKDSGSVSRAFEKWEAKFNTANYEVFDDFTGGVPGEQFYLYSDDLSIYGRSSSIASHYLICSSWI